MHREKFYHEEMMEQMWIAQRDEQVRKALQREQIEVSGPSRRNLDPLVCSTSAARVQEFTRKKKGQELAQMQMEQLTTHQERMAVAKMVCEFRSWASHRCSISKTLSPSLARDSGGAGHQSHCKGSVGRGRRIGGGAQAETETEQRRIHACEPRTAENQGPACSLGESRR